MRTIPLGSQGLLTSEVGFGAWGLSGDYGAADDQESIATLHRAIDLGVTMIDTADRYGYGHNERLVGAAIQGRRDEVILATKTGLMRDEDGTPALCGRPEYIAARARESLDRLRVEYVDLFYLHRPDPSVPIEESAGALRTLIDDGITRHVGLCEVSAALVRRAHAVCPISCVQSEYSLVNRDPEQDLLPVLAELGIGFVAFSPLGRGLLTGRFDATARFGEGDLRRVFPRFNPENLERNVALLGPLEAIAVARGCTSGEVALAWLIAQGAVPIPGTRFATTVELNAGAAAIRLTPDELDLLDRAFPPGAATGDRYPASLAHLQQGSTSPLPRERASG